MANYLIRNTQTAALHPTKASDESAAYMAVIEGNEMPNSVASAPLEILANAWVSFGHAPDAKRELWEAMGPQATEADRDAVWEMVNEEDGAYYLEDLIKAIEAKVAIDA